MTPFVLSIAFVIAAGPAAAALLGPVPGPVFAPGETATIAVPQRAPELRWTLTDAFGATVATGQARAGGAVTLHWDRPGYYELTVSAPRRPDERRAFAVLPEPDTTPPSPRRPVFGVVTHFAHGWKTDILPLLARAGIRAVRDELYWEQVEKAPGRYRFHRGFTGYMAALDRWGIDPLIVLSFANPLYDEGLTPHSDAGRRAFAAYADSVLRRFPRQIGAVEVWNEYNGTWCEGPCRSDRPAFYTRMLADTYATAKRRRPDVTVAGGAVIGVPIPYLRQLAEDGALRSLDALVVHPYREVPEGVDRAIARVRALAAAYGRPDLPIWVTEFGRKETGPDARRRVAAYLVRHATQQIAAGVDRLYWYLARDYQSFDGMGLLREADSPLGPYAPTPAYVAYATLIRQLSGAESGGRADTDPRTYLYRFVQNGKPVAVVWSPGGEARLSLATDGPLQVVTMSGAASRLASDGGRVELAIGPDPVYVRGDFGAVRDLRPERLITDAALSFGDTQGEDGWSYGVYDGDGKGHGNGATPAGAYSDDDFEPLTWTGDEWGEYWGERRYRFLKIGPDGAHPGVYGDHPVWAVRRWTATEARTVRILARAHRRDRNGDGSRAVILVDGEPVVSIDLGPGKSEPVMIDRVVAVRRGGTIDFAVTPGGGTDIAHDFTRLEIQLLDPAPAAPLTR